MGRVGQVGAWIHGTHAAMGRPQPEWAPPLWVPLRYVAAGIVFGLAGLILVAVEAPAVLAGPPGLPVLLATVHTLTLGFLTITMLGALSQWIPVVSGQSLPQPLRGPAPFLLFVGGLGLFLPGLGTMTPGLLAVGGVFVVTGLLWHVLAVFRLLHRTAASALPLRFVEAALGYLALAALAGTTLGAGFFWPGVPAAVLPIHILLALGGFAGFTWMGLTSRLLPMFLATRPTPWGLRPAWVLGHAAIAGGILAAVTGATPARLAAVSFGTLAFAAYAVPAVLSIRERAARGAFDVATMVLAAAPVAMVAGAGLLLTEPATSWLRGVLALLLGGFYLSIVGYAERILPFMVWLAAHKIRRHTPHVPALWPPAWSTPISLSAMAGATLTGAGLASGTVELLRAGTVLQSAALLGMGIGIGRMLRLAFLPATPSNAAPETSRGQTPPDTARSDPATSGRSPGGTPPRGKTGPPAESP